MLAHRFSPRLPPTVMETVDPEISGSCKDLEVVKKAFQLALLCTKRQASDRPKMHEVARVLGSPTQQDNSREQVPVTPPPTVASYMDDGYTKLN